MGIEDPTFKTTRIKSVEVEVKFVKNMKLFLL